MTGNSPSPRPLITYRLAEQKDFAFLYDLHRASMRAQVEAMWGKWEEDWQQAYFRKKFTLEGQRIIQWNHLDVGAVLVQERAEEYFLVALKVHPRYQGRGIGTAVLRDLIRLADSTHRQIALRVLATNPRARALYQRLGFRVTGKTGTHWILAREPERQENPRQGFLPSE